MPGADGSEWVINNYVDLNPGNGATDYTGGNKTYNNHRGIDIDVPSFLAMDGDFPVRSVERGFVVALDDVHFDRNTTCTGQWNFVTVQHDDGLRTTYGHLKQNSVIVSVGQVVARGQDLAVVGSSGCSTHPHLHLETRDAANVVIDPFREGLWQNPPVYDTPLSVMETVLTEGAVGGIPEIADPGPSITQLSYGEILGVGMSVAGGAVGDQIKVLLKRPDGTLHSQGTITFSQVHRHSFWIKNFTPQSILGNWTIEILTNGLLAASFPVAIGPAVNIPRISRFLIPQGSYQGEFDYYANLGYRPVWIDGFDVNGSTYFNAIFEQDTSVPWMAFHNMTGASLDNWLSQFTGTSWRPTHIESYYINGSIRYALLAEDSPGPLWAAYRSASGATHQANFNSLVGQGYHATLTSPLMSGSNVSITALYEKSSVGLWSAYYGMTAAAYQTLFTSEAQAGRYLSYLNVYDDGGMPRFSAIWNSVQPNTWNGQHGLSASALNTQHNNLEAQGLLLRFVTGYAVGTTPYFGGCWKN